MTQFYIFFCQKVFTEIVASVIPCTVFFMIPAEQAVNSGCNSCNEDIKTWSNGKEVKIGSDVGEQHTKSSGGEALEGVFKGHFLRLSQITTAKKCPHSELIYIKFSRKKFKIFVGHIIIQ